VVENAWSLFLVHRADYFPGIDDAASVFREGSLFFFFPGKPRYKSYGAFLMHWSSLGKSRPPFSNGPPYFFSANDVGSAPIDALSSLSPSIVVDPLPGAGASAYSVAFRRSVPRRSSF